MTENYIGIANATGFPLQAAIEEVARKRQDDHYWYLISRERSWKHPVTGETRFIDLILGGNHYTFHRALFQARAVIECKRVDGSMVFLVPSSSQPQVNRSIRVFAVKLTDENTSRGWRELEFYPEMFSAQFCASGVRKGGRSNQPDSRTLEGWCSELLSSTAALAQQELSDLENRRNDFVGAAYIPIIVTTADLALLRFDPSKVDLQSGMVPPPPDSQAENIDWIKFSKDFGFEPYGPNPLDPRSRPYQTVFIVKASAFEQFIYSARIHYGL